MQARRRLGSSRWRDDCSRNQRERHTCGDGSCVCCRGHGCSGMVGLEQRLVVGGGGCARVVGMAQSPGKPCIIMAQTVARTVSFPRIVSLDMVGSDRAIRPLAHPLLFVDDLGQRHRRLRGGQAFWQAQTLAFSFAREVLGRNPWRGGRFCKRGLGCARFGVDLARRVDGAAVHGRGFDPKRVEAPAKHEGLGKFAAGTRRNHGQV